MREGDLLTNSSTNTVPALCRIVIHVITVCLVILSVKGIRQSNLYSLHLLHICDYHKAQCLPFLFTGNLFIMEVKEQSRNSYQVVLSKFISLSANNN